MIVLVDNYDSFVHNLARYLRELGWATDRGRFGVSEDQQAQFLTRTYVMALAHPSVEKIFWYDFRNDSAPGAPYDRPVYNEREHEFHFGLLRRTFPRRRSGPWRRCRHWHCRC